MTRNPRLIDERITLKYGTGGGLWHALAFYRKLAIVEDARIAELAPTGEELGEVLQPVLALLGVFPGQRRSVARGLERSNESRKLEVHGGDPPRRGEQPDALVAVLSDRQSTLSPFLLLRLVCHLGTATLVGAIVLGGLLLSTVLTLFVVPSAFTLLWRLRGHVDTD